MATTATQEKKSGTGRKYTQRKPLAAKDEKKLDAVDKAFESSKEETKVWARRYGAKVLKHAAGLRATPAPIPPELGETNAAKVRKTLGIADPAPKAKTDSKPKTSTRKSSTKKTDSPPAAEPLEGEPA